MKNQIIIITGPKHSGKTVCARALAKVSGGVAADLDALVTKETEKTPRELFKEGPEIFRKAEASVLASLALTAKSENKLIVIAAGGGLIDNPEALALLSQHREIITVYLDVPAETAWQRILNTAAADGELPPFLKTENPRETHFALHTRRAKGYKALAQFTVSADNKSPEEIADEIARYFQLLVNSVMPKNSI